MRAIHGSARILKKLMTGRSSQRSSSSSSTKNESKQLSSTSVAPTNTDNNAFPTTDSKALIDNATGEPVKDVNNNQSQSLVVAGPLLKVVVSPERGPVELLDSSNGATIIHTDASVRKNGITGIGVYFGEEHPLNTSERLPGKHKSTNWAEIIAATTALQKLRDWNGYNQSAIILRTDSLPIVEAMQNEVNSDHRYFVELSTLKKIAQSFPQGVQFEHVYAHNGDPGNEAADALATKATSYNNTPSPRRTRSKPPSKRMSRRTRSAYIKRSAPAKLGPNHHRRQGAGRDPPSETFLRDYTAPAAAVPVPDVIARRELDQQELDIEVDTNESSAASSLSQQSTSSNEEFKPDQGFRRVAEPDTIRPTRRDEPRRSQSTPARMRSTAQPSGANVTPQPRHPSEARNRDGRPITYAPTKPPPARRIPQPSTRSRSMDPATAARHQAHILKHQAAKIRDNALRQAAAARHVAQKARAAAQLAHQRSAQGANHHPSRSRAARRRSSASRRRNHNSSRRG